MPKRATRKRGNDLMTTPVKDSSYSAYEDSWRMGLLLVLALIIFCLLYTSDAADE